MDKFEFELIYEMAYCRYINETATPTLIQQQLILNDDKDDLEAFQITVLVMDVEDDDNIYNAKEL